MKEYILLIFATEGTGKLREEILPSFLPCVQFFNIDLTSSILWFFCVTVFHKYVLKIYNVSICAAEAK